METWVIPKSVTGIFRVLEMGFWLASQCGCLGVPYLYVFCGLFGERIIIARLKE